jgi:hypothetical protein
MNLLKTQFHFTQLKRSVLLVCVIVYSAHAESRTYKWTHWGLVAGACAASAVDGLQSVKYLDGHHGLYEVNPILRNSNGTINISRMVTLKTGVCAVPVIFGLLKPSNPETMVEVFKNTLRGNTLPVVFLSAYTGTILWNQHIINTHEHK